MYKEHEAFTPPPPDAILWRYMDFTKFVSLLEKQALFFARADKLEDPFEGAWPNSSREAAQKFLKRLTNLNHHKLWELSLTFIRALPRFTLINCWHESDHESAAMWELYSKDSNGIALKTNFGSLAKSFTTNEVVHIGEINYIDYETVGFYGNQWWFSAFLYKRESFEYEREVRAIVQIIPPGNRILPLGHQDEGTEGVIDLSQNICEMGHYYEVNLSILIHEVIVDPYAPDWFLELVQSVADRYNLESPVIRSTLADNPTWD